MENVVRFWEWKRRNIEILAHEAIAFKIWELLPTVGTTDTHEQSELLGKMIEAAKGVIDTEIHVFSGENKENTDELLRVYRNLPDANKFELSEIRVELPDQKIFFLNSNPKLPVKINWYRFKKKMDSNFRYYWEFIEKV